MLVGPPGSGKGTQAGMLAKHFGVPSLSTGGLLRQLADGPEPGASISRALNRGDLVSDDVVVGALRDAIARAAPSGGYILDGFPRTVSQARRVEPLLVPDAVIHLRVPDDVARARLARRGEGRSDDDDRAVVERRLRSFHDEIEPILEHYRDRGVLVTVDADQAPDVVHDAILHALANKRQERNHGVVEHREPDKHD